MGLKYRHSNGTTYVSYAKSIREGKKVRTEYIYIGKVVDEKAGLYFNKDLGFVTFDNETKQIVPAPDDILPENFEPEEEEDILDFGKCYFLDAYLRKSGIMSCMEAIEDIDLDTFCALIAHYTLTHETAHHIREWYVGNYASVLYPDAKLEPREVVNFLHKVGGEKAMKAFFDVYFPLISGKKPDDFADSEVSQELDISIKEVDLPERFGKPLSPEYRSMGAKGDDLRLVLVHQQGTQIPLYFRYVPTQYVESTGLSAVNQILDTLGVGANFALMDTSYCSVDNVVDMCHRNIPFISTVPEDNPRYSMMKSMIVPKIRNEAYFHENLGRTAYVKEMTRTLRDTTCYVYAVLRESYATTGGNEVPEHFYVFVSSQKKAVSDVLSTCFMREGMEKFFESAKEYAPTRASVRVTPEAVRGHMIISFVSAAVSLMIKNDLDRLGLDMVVSFYLMNNQKCKVYPSRIVPARASKDLMQVYKAFDIPLPGVIPRK